MADTLEGLPQNMPVEWWVEQVCEAWIHPIPTRPDLARKINLSLAAEWPRLAATLEGLAIATAKAHDAEIEEANKMPRRRRWPRK